jgi:peptide/nickel transport system substrate-binding protein
MKRRYLKFAAIGLALAMPAAAGAQMLVEPPSLAPLVEGGKLPPLAQRLPDTPVVLAMDQPGQSIGRHGGTLNTIMARSKDVRLMVVYGYARLVKFDRNLNLVPDILERIEVKDGKIFTFYLRPGHKWSDGQPFTTEDFRYYWEDVANNDLLSPIGPSALLRVDGELPTVTFIDKTTLRYAWSKPNPAFLPALAGARPFYIYRPAHYLRKYHARYNDTEKLNAKAKQKGQRSWAALHNKYDHQYKNKNIELPTLQPWVNTTEGPAERFIFKRNPYYYKIDRNGLQLPYIDQVIFSIASGKIIPAQVGTGQSDLQARYLRFANFTFLKANEKKSRYQARLWRIAKGSHLTLFPNLNVNDPVWRKLLREVRFRRALSLAVDRFELNQVIYYGLAIEAQNTVLPESTLFRKEYQKAWAKHDPSQANRLLDSLGLDKRNDSGIRLLPDGRPIEIIVESTGESTEEADILELVADQWAKVGVKMLTKPSQREVMRNRIYAGETLMAISSGLENGVPTADMDPSGLAPTEQVQYQWSKWGQYRESNGRMGQPIDMAVPKRLAALNAKWRLATGTAQRRDIWHEMLAINADRVFTIGLISGVLQPVVVRNNLRNVPVKGIYNWDPGAHFGIYGMDSFWFAPEAAAK